jgi:hypothetical protein
VLVLTLGVFGIKGARFDLVGVASFLRYLWGTFFFLPAVGGHRYMVHV